MKRVQKVAENKSAKDVKEKEKDSKYPPKGIEKQAKRNTGMKLIIPVLMKNRAEIISFPQLYYLYKSSIFNT